MQLLRLRVLISTQAQPSDAKGESGDKENVGKKIENRPDTLTGESVKMVANSEGACNSRKRLLHNPDDLEDLRPLWDDQSTLQS